MPIQRKRPEGYSDDPEALADQISEGLAKSDPDNFEPFEATVFYVGEMKLIERALRALVVDRTRGPISGEAGEAD